MVHIVRAKLIYPVINSKLPGTLHPHMEGVSKGFVLNILSEDMNILFGQITTPASLESQRKGTMVARKGPRVLVSCNIFHTYLIVSILLKVQDNR